MTANKTTTKAVAVAASDEVLAQLASAYPQEEGGKGIFLPRLGMVSQDVVETTGTGKNKKTNIITPAGEFFIEQQTDELDEDGKKKWERQELGDTIEGIIFYKRHQLRMYDEDTEEYTSSPVYDSPDEILPLFCNKKEVARGTPKELKAKYMFTDKKGKVKSALEDNRVLYVLKDGEAYQMSLRGSSMYSLLSYEKGVQPPTVVTQFTSEPNENGGIAWNKMLFKALRKLNAKEAKQVADLQKNTAETIKASKESYQKADDKSKAADKEMEDLVEDAKKALE